MTPPDRNDVNEAAARLLRGTEPPQRESPHSLMDLLAIEPETAKAYVAGLNGAAYPYAPGSLADKVLAFGAVGSAFYHNVASRQHHGQSCPSAPRPLAPGERYPDELLQRLERCFAEDPAIGPCIANQLQALSELTYLLSQRYLVTQRFFQGLGSTNVPEE